MRQTGWKTTSLTFSLHVRKHRQHRFRQEQTRLAQGSCSSFTSHFVLDTLANLSHAGDLLSAYVSLPPSLLEGRGVSGLTEDEVGICLKTPL